MTALRLAVVACLGFLAACGTAPPSPSPRVEQSAMANPEPPNPATLVRQIALQADPLGPYRDPTADERRIAGKAVEELLADPGDTGGHSGAFASLGFSLTTGTDPVTDRDFALYRADSSTQRSWGAVLVDLSTKPDLVVEVPHPGFDVNTDVIGVDLFRARPGSLLLIAGAHRQASQGQADVAHNDQSMFHAIATTLAEHGLPQLQLHGFADANLPDADVAVSNGSAEVVSLHRGIVERLRRSGFTVCAAWRDECGRLEGTTNAQGQAAAEQGEVFVHLEASWSVRGDELRRDQLVSALAAVAIKRS